MAEETTELRPMIEGIVHAIVDRSTHREYKPYMRVAADLHHALGGREVEFALCELNTSEESAVKYDGAIAVYASEVVAFLYLFAAPSALHDWGPVNHPEYQIVVRPRTALTRMDVEVPRASLHRQPGSIMDGLEEYVWGTKLSLFYGAEATITATVNQQNQDLHKVHASLLADLTA